MLTQVKLSMSFRIIKKSFIRINYERDIITVAQLTDVAHDPFVKIRILFEY